jgi:hypothetical protein
MKMQLPERQPGRRHPDREVFYRKKTDGKLL